MTEIIHNMAFGIVVLSMTMIIALLIKVFYILATYRMKAIFLDGIEYNCQHPIYAIQKHFGIKNEN